MPETSKLVEPITQEIVRVAVVVDAFSAGKLYAKEFNRQGIQCIHVVSKPGEFKHGSTINEDDFIERQTHYGVVADTVDSLKQYIANNNYELVCVVPGSECGVELADSLSESLGMASTNGTALSEARRNKYKMVEALQAKGVKTVSHFKSTDVEEILLWIDLNTDYPVVVKALDSAGTNGVFVCHSADEVRFSYSQIFGVENYMGKMNKEVLVQSYLHGIEYVVNTVSRNGQRYIVDLWEYRKQEVPGYGKIYDRDKLISFDGDIQDQLIAYNSQVLDALQIQNGPSHAEIMMTPEGPVLVEVGARIGGGTNMDVSNQCVGLNAVQLSVACYVNPDEFYNLVKDERKVTKFAMIVDLANKRSGLIEKLTLEEAVAKLPSYHSVSINVMVGDTLKPTIDIFSTLMSVQLVHEDPAQLEADYLAILEMAVANVVLKHDLDLRAQALFCATHEKKAGTNLYQFFKALHGQYDAKTSAAKPKEVMDKVFEYAGLRK